MAKVDIDLVKFVLFRNEIDTLKVAQIMEDVRKEMEMQAAEEPKEPAVKKQFVIMISDPQGELPAKDFVGWVLQIPEDESPATTEDRLIKASYEFNISPKGRRMPVQSIGEACEAVPARLLKEQNVWVKTKEPILMVKSANAIPMDKLDELADKAD